MDENFCKLFSSFILYPSEAAFDLRKGAPMNKFFFHPRYYFHGPGAVGLFILRVFVGYAMALHGLEKMQNPMGWMPGGDIPGFLQALAAVAEFFGGLAIMFGFFTPLACLGVMSTMFVATLFILHKSDWSAYFVAPQSAKGAASYESSAVYFIFALVIFLTGPGLLSVDAALTKLMNKRGAATPTP